MKKVLNLIITFAVLLMGSSVFASGAVERFLSPNADIYEVRASHVLVKTRKEAVQIKKDIEESVLGKQIGKILPLVIKEVLKDYESDLIKGE